MANWKVEVINGKEYWVRESDCGNKIVFGDPMDDLAKAQAKALDSILFKNEMEEKNARLEKEANKKYKVKDTEINLPQWNINTPNEVNDENILHEFVTDEELEQIEKERFDEIIKRAEIKYKEECMNNALAEVKEYRALYKERYIKLYGSNGVDEALKKIEDNNLNKIKDTYGDIEFDKVRELEFLARTFKELSEDLFVKYNEKEVKEYRTKQNTKWVWVALALLIAGIILGITISI